MNKQLVLPNSYRSNFSDQESRDFQYGKWRTDCPHIEIRQRNTDSPYMHSGPGYIIQDEDHQLCVKIYVISSEGVASENGTFRQQRLLPDSFSLEAGDLVPEDHYFDLEALDQEGRLWKAERVSLNGITHHTANGMIFELYVYSLCCKAPWPPYVPAQEDEIPPKEEKFFTRLTVFHELKFPHNAGSNLEEKVEGEVRRRSSKLNAWQFEAAGCDIELLESDDHVEIVVKSPFTHWPPEFIDRVTDALFFTLGKPIYPSIAYSFISGIISYTIYSRQIGPKAATHKPPLHLAPNADWGTGTNRRTPYRDMIDAYLRFVLTHQKPRYPWTQLHAVYESSSAKFSDAHALTLSVVIESFVNSEFEELGQPTGEFLELVKEAKELISDQSHWEKDAKDRFKGALGSLKRPRIGDRLRILANTGRIEVEAPKKWTAIRNGTAHSYQRGSIEDDEFRAYSSSLEVLFFHIFFCAIGYRGPFTNYGKRSFPMEFYPLNVAWKLTN